MKTFTIENETNNITLHGSAKEAEAAQNSEGFSSEADLGKLAANWPAARLVEIWNTMPGETPVKKFKDRITAVSRIWRAMQNLADSVPAEFLGDETEQPEKEPDGETAVAAECEISPDGATETLDEPEDDTPDAPQSPNVAPEEAPSKNAAMAEVDAPKPPARKTRGGTKTETVLALMKQTGGTSLKIIMEATGWQAHSVRGFISGTLTKKMGLSVVSAKGENGERTYTIKA
ncbi:MAG: hypothetical protein JWN34_2058 [Bryobacterales bacterium]|nr:hypothetical protein [Bryobacterales bacterium]